MVPQVEFVSLREHVTTQGGTVKVAVHVTGASQVLVTVKVTVLVPPAHTAGAIPLSSFDNLPLHPPVKLAVVNQAV